MTDAFGPCADWNAVWPCDVSAESPTATGRAVAAATEVLWGLSGRQYGLCTVTVRPCRSDCGTGYESWYAWTGSWSSSYTGVTPFGTWWLPLSCESCRGSCSCTYLSEVVLPSPVSSIVSVKMDGTPMVTGAYRLDDNRRLVRTDGHRWPYCNDLTKDDTQSGTWSVTATYGVDVPQMGQFAVGELACELLKAMSGQDCRLPTGTTEVIRQGVTAIVPDIGDYLSRGRTGLYMVDMFLTAVNPHRLAQRSRTYSVDHPLPRRTGS